MALSGIDAIFFCKVAIFIKKNTMQKTFVVEVRKKESVKLQFNYFYAHADKESGSFCHLFFPL